MKRCPFCAEEIQDAAIVCRFCNADLVTNTRPHGQSSARRSAPSPGVAAVLSLVIPGAGQMYRGDVGLGLIWLVLVIGGYLFLILPGLLLHLTCVLTAASGIKQETGVEPPVTSAAVPVAQPPATSVPAPAGPPTPLFTHREKLVGGLLALGLFAALIGVPFMAKNSMRPRQSETPLYGLPISFGVSETTDGWRVNNDTEVRWEVCRAEIGQAVAPIEEIRSFGAVEVRRREFSPPVARDATVNRSDVKIRCQRRTP